MDRFYPAGKPDQVKPGHMALKMVGNEVVLLANVDGRLYATSGFCTHDRAALPYGILEGEEVTCQLHWARFSVVTGRVLEGPAEEDLERFAVKVEGDELFIGPVED